MADNIRILILEDRASDADLIEEELVQSGLAFTAKRTMNEKEFLRACEEFCPDLILSDYELPQYNGALALTEAKRRLPDTPFILVTGALDKGEERIRKVLAGGATDVVLKSHLDRLVPAVHDALRAKERT